MSHSGRVASGHPFTTFVGLEALKSGGNAFDAAVAASLAAGLSEPLLTSLGGGGLLLSEFEGEVTCYDFFTNFPGLSQRDVTPHLTTVTVQFTSCTQDFKIGPGSVAVPGTLKGLIEVHREKGIIPLQKLIGPVIKASSKGIALNETQNYVLSLLDPVLSHTQQGRDLYFRNGRRLHTGDLFKNPLYGHFIKNLEENCESFYNGKLGQETLKLCEQENLIAQEDLKAYQVTQSPPLEFDYGNARFLTVPPPAHGGHYLKLLFALLENRKVQNYQWGSFDHLKTIAEVLIQLETGKSSAEFHPFTKGTTHISVSDAFGNHVSLSLTNGEGSGIFIPESGVMLNNMLGEDDICSDNPDDWKPGHRLPSMMAPSLVLRPGQSTIVTGSGGSKRIRSSLLQVLSNIVDFNMDLKSSVEAPRLNWDGEALQMEPGYDPSVIELMQQEIPINLWDEIDFYFGGTHTVVAGSESIGDLRRGGDGKSV